MAGVDVTGFNDVSAHDAAAILRAVCASPRWVELMMSARPFATIDALHSTAAELVDALPWAEVLLALAAHPRVGERPTGTDRESEWSRQEQAAAAAGDADLDAALALGNLGYERRFGHVFLVCATGLSRREVLDRLLTRSTNGETEEQAVVRRELAAIVDVRLAKALG